MMDPTRINQPAPATTVFFITPGGDVVATYGGTVMQVLLPREGATVYLEGWCGEAGNTDWLLREHTITVRVFLTNWRRATPPLAHLT